MQSGRGTIENSAHKLCAEDELLDPKTLIIPLIYVDKEIGM